MAKLFSRWSLPEKLITVTPFSKLIAAVLFVALPIYAFLLGLNYQVSSLSSQTSPTLPTPVTLEPVSISRVEYAKLCKVIITLSSGQSSVVDVTNAFDKRCSSVIRPYISPDGSYAAFELWLTTKDELTGSHGSDNTLMVYLASKRDWVKVFNYGAASTHKLSSDTDNNLLVDIQYDSISHWQIQLANLEKHFTEIVDPTTHEINFSPEFLPSRIVKPQSTTPLSEETAINLLKNRPEVKAWLSMFSTPRDTNPATDGKAVFTLESKDDQYFVIRVYEDIPTNPVDETFNWYKVNRNTAEVTIEYNLSNEENI